MDYKAVARRAAELLSVKGWCKDVLYDDKTGAYCIAGACNVALRERNGISATSAYSYGWLMDTDSAQFYRKLRAAMQAEYPDLDIPTYSKPDDSMTVVYFNNNRNTDEEDIFRVLGRLAAE